MSRTSESGEHELYVTCLFADGMSGGTTSGQGVAATRTPDGRELAYDDWQWRSEEEVVGWLVCCDCRTGGTSRPTATVLARWERVRPPHQEDPARGRFTAEGPWAASSLDDREDVYQLTDRLWDAHLAPELAVQAISDAARAVRHATQQLDDAVLAARNAGLSWVDIGRGAGITRQSARERWSTREPA